MTYKKLKELGYTSDKWKGLTQEQANKIVASNKQAAASSGNSGDDNGSNNRNTTNEKSESTAPELPKEISNVESYPENIREHIRTYNKLIKAEPKISKDIKSVADELGLNLLGFDFRIKGNESFIRKAKSEPNNPIKDAVRYTYEFNGKQDADNVISKLKNKGYKVFALRNYWNIPNSAYRGVNANFITPDGDKIEIQFHTQEDLEVKEQNHKYYEKQRLLDRNKDKKKWMEYDDIMIKNASKLKMPKNIDLLQDIK